MDIMNIDMNTQWDILRIAAGILHLGNITFVEKGANASDPADASCGGSARAPPPQFSHRSVQCPTPVQPNTARGAIESQPANTARYNSTIPYK